MMSALDTIFYIFAFLAIYVQVFFFLTLILDKSKIRKQKLISDEELPAVTFLVPCWNEEETIEGTIESIWDLDYPKSRIKIVIVDDGSTDNTWKVLQQYKNHPDIRILHKENGGKASAANLALKYVKTQYMCSIDADTFLEKDALRTIMTYFVRRPDLSSVGGTVLIHDPESLAQSAQSVDYQMFSFSKKMLGLLGAVLVAPGAFSLYKTKVLKEIGGYKEGHGLEDLELTFRMQKDGFKVDHCHNAIAYTKGPETLPGLFKQRLRWSYGFLSNTYDYRKVFLNKNFGVFGLFTVPMGVISYFVIVYMFLMSWYFIFSNMTNVITRVSIQGFDSLMPSLEFFFVNTKPMMVLALLMYGFILLTILLGRYISGVKKHDYHRLPLFFLVYGALVPFWVLRSLYNFVFSKRPAWR